MVRHAERRRDIVNLKFKNSNNSSLKIVKFTIFVTIFEMPLPYLNLPSG